MSKKDVLMVYPDAYCKQENNNRFYIFMDNTNPVFPHGHASALKAWKDLEKMSNVLKDNPPALTK